MIPLWKPNSAEASFPDPKFFTQNEFFSFIQFFFHMQESEIEL
jgi:hypothetical protein